MINIRIVCLIIFVYFGIGNSKSQSMTDYIAETVKKGNTLCKDSFFTISLADPLNMDTSAAFIFDNTTLMTASLKTLVSAMDTSMRLSRILNNENTKTKYTMQIQTPPLKEKEIRNKILNCLGYYLFEQEIDTSCYGVSLKDSVRLNRLKLPKEGERVRDSFAIHIYGGTIPSILNKIEGYHNIVIDYKAENWEGFYDIRVLVTDLLCKDIEKLNRGLLAAVGIELIKKRRKVKFYSIEKLP